MSTVIATSVLPDSTANDTLTIGATGDSVVIGGNLLTMNTLQDAGGNTFFVSNGSGVITSSGFGGATRLILTSSVSNGASISFTSGIDSTYDIYIFRYGDLNPVTDAADFSFQASTDGGSSYGVTMTTTFFHAMHTENNDYTNLSYVEAADLAQSTNYQTIGRSLSNDADAAGVGELYLYAPSSTTYVKQFYATVNGSYVGLGPATEECFIGGYFNTTSAINAINFKCSSGNFDGTISLYGISKS